MTPRRKRKAVQARDTDNAEEDDQENLPSQDESHSESGQSEPEPNKSAKKPAKRAKVTKASGVSLLEICKAHKGAVSSAAKAWVDRCKASKISAVAELLTFIVQAAGSEYVVSSDEVEEGEIDKLVADIREEVSEEGFVDYFKGKGHKTFVASYLQLLDLIVQFCYEQDNLLDDPIIDAVSRLSTGLSSSDVRSFRYVGTLTACHLATSLIKVMFILSEEQETAQRQEAAETRKKGEDAKGRERAFKRAIDKCQSEINEVQEHVANIFQSVTTNRFRDTCDEIRAIVIETIGNWTELFPANYLKDLYLKYLGWALSDQAGPVREAAADALLALYSQESNLNLMKEFTERFKPRFLELPNDIDENVAVKGVKLLTVLVQVDQVSFAEVNGRYKLLLEESDVLRDAAAELVTELLAETGKQYILKLQEKQRGRRKSLDNMTDAEKSVAGLLHIFTTLSSDLEENEEIDPAVTLGLAFRIVDALFDRVEVLHDWKELSKALLDDKACERRGELATLHLAFLFQAAAHRACTGGMELSSHGPSRKQGARNKLAAAADNHKHELSMAMTEYLLPLLRKHQADPFLAGAFVSVIQHLNLDIFSLKRAEETLKNILHMCASLLAKHAQPETTRACCQALQHCANPGGSTSQEPGYSVFANAIANTGKALQSSSQAVLNLSEADLDDPTEQDEDEFLICHGTLLKVYNLLLMSSLLLKDANIMSALDTLANAALEGKSLPPSLVGVTVQCCTLSLLWKLQIHMAEDSEEAASDADFSTSGLEYRLVREMIQTNDFRLKSICVRCLCDLYQIFSSVRIKDALNLGSSGIQASTRDAAVLWLAGDSILRTEIPNPEDSPEESSDVLSAKSILEGQRGVIHALSRLCIHKVQMESFGNLPGKLLSYLESSQPVIATAVGELHLHISKKANKEMPAVYAQAIITGFERLGERSEELSNLCKRFAKLHSAFVTNAGASVLQIIRSVINFTFQGDVKSHAPILGCLVPLIARMAAKDLAGLETELRQEAEKQQADSNEPLWDGLFDLIRAIEGRTTKGTHKSPRSALKKPSSAPKKANPGRKISFKDANKIQKPSARVTAVNTDDEDATDPVENSSSEDEGNEAAPSPPPRFHAKTRRGSQMLSPPQTAAVEERNDDSDADNDPGSDEEDVEEEGANGTPMDMILANTAEQMPSELFLARSTGPSVDQAAGSGDEEDEEEEEEVSLPRVRYRQA